MSTHRSSPVDRLRFHRRWSPSTTAKMSGGLTNGPDGPRKGGIGGSSPANPLKVTVGTAKRDELELIPRKQPQWRGAGCGVLVGSVQAKTTFEGPVTLS